MDIVFDPCLPLVLEPAADSSADELASIDDAIQMWNATGATHITRAPVEGAPRLPVRFEKAASLFFGIYLDETGELVVNRTMKNRQQRAITIAHELGHAYGLWHVDPDARKSLMNTGNLTIGPLPADVAVLEATWGTCADR